MGRHRHAESHRADRLDGDALARTRGRTLADALAEVSGVDVLRAGEAVRDAAEQRGLGLQSAHREIDDGAAARTRHPRAASSRTTLRPINPDPPKTTASLLATAA